MSEEDMKYGVSYVAVPSDALSIQIGGSHYKDFAIQPVEFIERNGLGFCVGNCIKYLCRFDKKNGKEDLLKARHFIDLLIEMRYPDNREEGAE